MHFLKSKTIKKVGFDETEKFIPAGVKTVMEEVKPDVVVCMEYNPCAIMVKHWCNVNKVPYVSWSDGTRHSEEGIGFLQKLSRSYIVKNTAAFIASSTATKENQIYLGADPDKVYISYLTVDIEKYSIERNYDSADSGVLNILFVGRVVKLKGLELLLPIIKELEGVKLVIAGDGPELPEIRNLADELGIADRTEFKGYIEGEALKKCYKEADAFILPTKNDCFGLVILEAMCAGLPVIVSKYADGAPDLVETGKTGMIIDPYDDLQMKNAITKLIADRKTAVKMGRAGKIKSEEFSFDKVSKGFWEAVKRASNTNPHI